MSKGVDPSIGSALTKIIAWRGSVRARVDELTRMAGEAKGRKGLQPEISAALESLQELAHKKAVGSFEALLSGVVSDVLPGAREVVFDLGTDRSSPALEIHVKKNGKSEDLGEGAGGSINNLVSSGLRIAALAKSGNWPLLVMDEPDCWIKPSRVGRFASVIGEVAEEMMIQTIIISHHDPHHFHDASIVRLVPGANGLGAEVERTSAGVWGASDRGIVSLGVEGLMSHVKTEIPFGKWVTCLVGENDIGKSVVGYAFRALFYGESSDLAITHGKASFKVKAVFANGSWLCFEHFRNASPKRRWTCGVAGDETPQKDSSPKHGAPDWLADFCRIAKTDGLDIHFHKQKTPQFLLDQPAGKKASILSIGRESSFSQRLSAKNKQRSAEDSALIKSSEAELSSLLSRLAAVPGLDDLQERSIGLEIEGLSIEAKREEADSMALRLSRLERLHETIGTLDSGLKPLSLVSSPPALEDSMVLGAAVAAYARVRALASTGAVEMPSIPVLTESLEMGRRILAASAVVRVANTARPLEVPDAPSVVSTVGLDAALQRLCALLSVPDAKGADKLPAPPVLAESKGLADSLEKAWRLSKLPPAALLPAIPPTPELTDVSGLRRAGFSYYNAQRIAALKRPVIPSAPDVVQTGGLAKMISGAAGATTVVFDANGRLAKTREAESSILAKKDGIFNELGGVCPLCEQGMESDHGH